MTYSTVKGLVRTVLAAQSLSESDHFDIAEDGAVIQTSGYAIVLTGIGSTARASNEVDYFEATYDVHISKSYAPNQYAAMDDTVGNLCETVIAGINRIAAATLMANSITSIACGTGKAEHFEQGVLHVTIPVTIRYRT